MGHLPITVIVNEQVAVLPVSSRASYCTTCCPSTNKEPEGVVVVVSTGWIVSPELSDTYGDNKTMITSR